MPIELNARERWGTGTASRLTDLPTAARESANVYDCALVAMLADNADTLGEPYSRHLGGKVRELRFHLRRQQVRITYRVASGRRVVLLTVFYKTQRSEVGEVDRALMMQKKCEANHGHAADVYDRRISDE